MTGSTQMVDGDGAKAVATREEFRKMVPLLLYALKIWFHDDKQGEPVVDSTSMTTSSS
jgi:hypothetical protein